MRRMLFAASLVAGVALAACMGHTNAGAPLLPAGPQGGQSFARPGSAFSAQSRRDRVAPAGWALTDTQAFSLANAVDLGALQPATPVTVRLALQMRDRKLLDARIAGHQPVTRQAFLASFAPPPASVQRAVAYLKAQGFRNVTVEPNRLLVSGSGTAAKAQTAFHTSMHAFSQGGSEVFANVTPAYVPRALQGSVLAVLGLNDVRTFTTSPHFAGNATPRPSPAPTVEPASPCSLYGVFIIGLPSPMPEPSGITSVGCLRNYTPADYWRAYDAVNRRQASGISVAVMAEGDVTQSVSDLRVNEQGDGLRQAPVVVVKVGPGSTDTAGDDEWTLDMTASSGMARSVKTIYLYDTTSLTDSDIALEYSRWATDHLAQIGNSSFGGCEQGPYLDGSMEAMDQILAEAAAQGQTMFASTGDTGSFCSVGNPNGVPGGAPLVEYPAASPYTVAVGGTTLITDTAGNYQGEAPWYAGGGGVSQFEYSPAWESPTQIVGTTPIGFTFRGLPDIALDGDLQTGMILYLADAGGWTIIGGTSLSSPLAAGVWARVLQARGIATGYAAPLLYHNYVANSPGSPSVGPPPTRTYGAYHDVLVGANGLYTALPAWDFVTGMGSPDVGMLISHL